MYLLLLPHQLANWGLARLKQDSDWHLDCLQLLQSCANWGVATRGRVQRQLQRPAEGTQETTTRCSSQLHAVSGCWKLSAFGWPLDLPLKQGQPIQQAQVKCCGDEGSEPETGNAVSFEPNLGMPGGKLCASPVGVLVVRDAHVVRMTYATASSSQE